MAHDASFACTAGLPFKPVFPAVLRNACILCYTEIMYRCKVRHQILLQFVHTATKSNINWIFQRLDGGLLGSILCKTILRP